jgi:hypothetical protein
VRASTGTFTTVDFPAAVNGTAPLAINPAGVITGFYYDVNFAEHGFARAADGTLTTFDPPGSIFTNPAAIDPAGAVVAYYQDASLLLHGFLRAPDGTFTTIDFPAAMAHPPRHHAGSGYPRILSTAKTVPQAAAGNQRHFHPIQFPGLDNHVRRRVITGVYHIPGTGRQHGFVPHKG